MKIENVSRLTPLARSIERVVREEDGRLDVDAVTLDLDERKKGQEERQESPKRDRTMSETHPANAEEQEPKAPLNVVA